MVLSTKFGFFDFDQCKMFYLYFSLKFWKWLGDDTIFWDQDSVIVVVIVVIVYIQVVWIW